MVFKVKEKVMARWPGSSLWFEGTVMDFNDIEYQIMFNDEAKSEYVIKYKDVKGMDTFYRSRSGSRGRSKSRGRSAGRKGKAQEIKEKEKEVTPQKEEVKITNSKPEPRLEIKRVSPKPVPRLPSVDNLGPRTSTPTRQSLRIASLVDVTKHADDGMVNNVNANKMKTDVASKEAPAAGIGARLCSGVSCIGSCLKSVVLMFIPSLATLKVTPVILSLLALPLLVTRMCTKNKCTVMEVPDIPTKLEYYYDLKAVGIIAGFLLVQLLLGLIPLGRKVNLPNGAVVRCNGFINVLVSLALIPSLMYFDYNVLLVYALYQHFLATLTVLCVIISLLLYIRARHIPKDAKNPKGNTGLFLPDLFSGRELNPVFGSVDLKFFLVRSMCIFGLLLNIILVLKDLDSNKGQYSPTLFVACIFQMFCNIDLVWFEESLSTTYQYKRDGCGFLNVNSYLMAPFITAVFPRVVLNHRTELEWYFLSLIVTLNLIGYTISRGSLSQKHAFRTNPSDPALAHLESLPTSAGTRLLVSSWWGVVRHPNYLGDIIIIISWALLCGFKLALPWIIVALVAAILVGRIFEVESACKKKYGTAWDSYTGRVKCRLIPKVF